MGYGDTKTERDPPGLLLEASIATGDARRQLASGAWHGLAPLQARLTDALACVDKFTAAADGEGSLLALLDELNRLVGQLELKLEAARASLVAADRRRRAGATYGAARRQP